MSQSNAQKLLKQLQKKLAEIHITPFSNTQILKMTLSEGKVIA